MGKPKAVKIQKQLSWYLQLLDAFKSFAKKNWKGTTVILAATVVFFMPIISHIGGYIEPGDAMFNAWTLARNHHCMKAENCSDYTDGNIYHPHEDSMLFSETQTSAGLLTLPLSFVTDNYILIYNMWLIVSFFLNGWFMYLLAKRLSKGNEFFSILAALVFQFAPFKMGAIAHLQNLSIMYLPLAILMIIKYLDSRKRGYLYGLFATLTLLFYASWYQMVFGLAAVGVVIVAMLLIKAKNRKPVWLVCLAVIAALAVTMPLAREYIRFSSEKDTSEFGISSQTTYASSVADYFIPHPSTPIGQIYDSVAPENFRKRPYNLDSFSYHGIVLYALGPVLLVLAYRQRKKNTENGETFQWLGVWGGVALVGFLFSLGPFLKLGGDYTYSKIDGTVSVAVPLPYLLLDFAMPQIQFIRAVGRWSVLVLLALAAFIAYTPVIISRSGWSTKRRKWFYVVLVGLCIFELMPLRYAAKPVPGTYDRKLPPVYEFVRDTDEVDNILILSDEITTKKPGIHIRTEWMLWAGYHNKTMFNGYSGFTPEGYYEQYEDFRNFDAQDVHQLKDLDIRYVIADSYAAGGSNLPDRVGKVLPDIVYRDNRYVVYAVE